MNRSRGRSRGLRGATLALIAERGGHGYELAPEVLRLWMRSPVEKEPARPDLLARIASAMPADAAELTEALDEYERDLLRMLQANEEADLPVSSWSTLLLSVVRGHTDAQLQGELRWLDEARRRIEEFEGL